MFSFISAGFSSVVVVVVSFLLSLQGFCNAIFVENTTLI